MGTRAISWMRRSQGTRKNACGSESMRVSPRHRGRGIGKALMEHLIEEAKQRGYKRLSLQTGSMPFLVPARKLYEGFQFTPCAPFGSYREDPNSEFMTRTIGADDPRMP